MTGRKCTSLRYVRVVPLFSLGGSCRVRSEGPSHLLGEDTASFATDLVRYTLDMLVVPDLTIGDVEDGLGLVLVL